MSRRLVLGLVGLVVVLVVAVVVWRTTRPARPSAREQFRERLVDAPGVTSVRWSYAGGNVAVVRLRPHATSTQVGHLVRLGHTRCCESVLEAGPARMEIDYRATTRFVDLFASLAGVDVPASVTVPSYLPNQVDVRMRGNDPATALRTSQRLLSAGSNRLNGLEVQSANQDSVQYVFIAGDLGRQGVRNRLNQLLGIAADPSLRVEQVTGFSDAAHVQLAAKDRSQAAALWRRATAALRGHGVDTLAVRIGDTVLTATYGAPFSSAKPGT